MSEEKKYFCFCSSNCKYETMTKEQIMTAISQAAGGSVVDPDAAYISKVKEANAGDPLSFWVGTTAQYNALESKDANCLYVITDATSAAQMAVEFADVKQSIADTQQNIVDSTQGFGLGNHGTRITYNMLDATTANGWYSFGSSEAMTINGVMFSWANMLVAALKEENLRQILFPSSPNNEVMIRQRYGGVWSDWECVNPPAKLNVEYRTTERWMGKAIYTKVINCGVPPYARGDLLGETTGEHKTQMTQPVRCAGICGDKTLPYNESTGGLNIKIDSDYWYIAAAANTPQTTDICYLQMWYTKD